VKNEETKKKNVQYYNMSEPSEQLPLALHDHEKINAFRRFVNSTISTVLNPVHRTFKRIKDAAFSSRRSYYQISPLLPGDVDTWRRIVTGSQNNIISSVRKVNNRLREIIHPVCEGYENRTCPSGWKLRLGEKPCFKCDKDKEITVPSPPGTVNKVNVLVMVSNDLVASGCDDGCIHVWSVAKGTLKGTVERKRADDSGLLTDNVFLLTSLVLMSKEQQILAAGYEDGIIRLWKINGTGDNVTGITTLPRHDVNETGSVDSLIKTSTGRLVSLATNIDISKQKIRFWKLEGLTLQPMAFEIRKSFVDGTNVLKTLVMTHDRVLVGRPYYSDHIVCWTIPELLDVAAEGDPEEDTEFETLRFFSGIIRIMGPKVSTIQTVGKGVLLVGSGDENIVAVVHLYWSTLQDKLVKKFGGYIRIRDSSSVSSLAMGPISDGEFITSFVAGSDSGDIEFVALQFDDLVPHTEKQITLPSHLHLSEVTSIVWCEGTDNTKMISASADGKIQIVALAQADFSFFNLLT